MSAQVCGKKYATPLPFIPCPHPSPPPQRQLPRANGIGPFGSCDLISQWQWRPLAHSIGKLTAEKTFLTVFTSLLTYLLFLYQQATAAGNQHSVENQIDENSIL